jgi:hypothetical protein
LLREARVLSSTLKGGRSFALSGLDDLPDEELARLIPLVRPGFAIYVDGEHVVAQNEKTGDIVDLGPSTKENVVALNHFDGQVNLGAVGRRLAHHMGWDEARGFAHVKDLFLSLVGRLVCVPLNAFESEE